MTSPSRIEEILRRYQCASVVDPLMSVPTHLHYLKRHGFEVHGGELVDWFVRAGQGIVLNDLTILRDSDIAEIVEAVPGRLYAVERFKAWEGVFFTEEQCAYLATWHDNVHNLRSDGQAGLAILGLWNVLCYWLQKAQYPDDMPDIPPNELAWTYTSKMSEWVGANGRQNTVRQSDVLETIAANEADALFMVLPELHALRNADARLWMWEAWWQGDAYHTLEDTYRKSFFGRIQDEAQYEAAIARLLSGAAGYGVVILQSTPERFARLERVMRNARRSVETLTPNAAEAYLIARA